MFHDGSNFKPILARTTEAFPPPGICRQRNAEVIDMSLEDLKVSSVLLRESDTPVEHALDFRCWHGRMSYFRTSEETASWEFVPGDSGQQSLPLRESEARALASPILAALGEVCERLPDHHLPHPEKVTPEEQDLIRTELRARMDEGWPCSGRFDRGLLLMAQKIAAAREEDRRMVEKAKHKRRLRKQFTLLPTGTVLVGRNSTDAVAIVSDRPGYRTKRSLMLRCFAGGRAHRYREDAYLDILACYALMTPERAGQVSRVLSAHEALEAIQQAEALAPLCPDFL